jgi:hypothetical protein
MRTLYLNYQQIMDKNQRKEEGNLHVQKKKMNIRAVKQWERQRHLENMLT